MENSTTLDTGTAVVADNKLKGEIMENRCSMGNESRKGLSDISNLQQQHKVLNQGAKLLLQPDSIGTKEFIDKLQQENMMLMKVLADRNKVVKLSGIELQKLRINLEKFQQQNLILAQANSQMLAELNLSKDRLKALKHELGCKDAVLKAIKLELGTNKCGMEVESHKEEDGEGKLCNIDRCSEADESHEEDQGEDKPCNTNRKRQSYCLGTSNIKPVQVKEGVENKRVCSRRQSARRKAQEPETTESIFEVDDPKFLASSTSDDKVLESGPSSIKPVLSKEGIGNKSKVCSRRQSARRKAQEPETTADVVEVDDLEFLASSTSDNKMLESGPSNIIPVQAKEGTDNKSKVCSRRQSARCKAQEPETTEDVFEVDDPKFLASSTSDDKVHESGPSNIEPIQVKEGIDNKSKVCSRRQSARCKAEEPETTEDVFVVDDPKFLASSTSDDKVHESGPSNIEPIQVKEGIDNISKVCSRKLSVTRKAREPKATEDVFEVDNTRFLVFSTSDDKVYESGPFEIKPVQAKEGIDNKRACLRRQSGMFKLQEPETSKHVFEVDDARILVSSTSDNKVHESGQLSSDDSSVKSEHDNGNMTVSSRIEAQELRRVSAGRPLRRAVEKIQSYKEMKLNVKMRRKESLALNYTEQEIRQWREERKKFYPTKANIKKKLSGKVADTEVAKLRSEQLKEILAKQAELGVEVAEIPSHYLFGSEKKVNGREENHLLGSEEKVNGREENHRLSTKRGRFGTRKRGRPDKRDHFCKKPRSATEESLDGTSFNKRSPTLLQKLLNADIRKDKSRLLQVFRFMVMNSFFKDWPEKPLKFPVVVVKDGVSEGEIIEEKPVLGEEDNTVDAACDDEKDDTQVDKMALYVQEKEAKIVRNAEEEEEIID